MKKIILLSIIFVSFSLTTIKAQSVNSKASLNATSIGIVIYSNDTETVWNALRFANFS